MTRQVHSSDIVLLKLCIYKEKILLSSKLVQLCTTTDAIT